MSRLGIRDVAGFGATPAFAFATSDIGTRAAALDTDAQTALGRLNFAFTTFARAQGRILAAKKAGREPVANIVALRDALRQSLTPIVVDICETGAFRIDLPAALLGAKTVAKINSGVDLDKRCVRLIDVGDWERRLDEAKGRAGVAGLDGGGLGAVVVPVIVAVVVVVIAATAIVYLRTNAPRIEAVAKIADGYAAIEAEVAAGLREGRYTPAQAKDLLASAVKSAKAASDAAGGGGLNIPWGTIALAGGGGLALWLLWPKIIAMVGGAIMARRGAREAA